MSATNSGVFDQLEPSGVWRHFEAITQIARPSGEEKAMAGSIRAWAATHRFTVMEDAAGNLCVRVPATAGRDKAPVVVLQGHLDMVVANSLSALPEFDAGEGRIHLIRKTYPDGEYIEADVTTLGADNGIAISMMCAIADDVDAKHGPLELLMTVEEETSLVGAKQLDPSLIQGRVMLNLDSEDDHILFVGCAGGTDLRIDWNRPRTNVPANWIGLSVTLDKLRGGHSGAEIDKNRLNANKALARLLARGTEGLQARIGMLQGGDRRNAIARFASAEVWLAPDHEAAFKTKLNAALLALTEQYRKLEPTIELATARIAGRGEAAAFAVDDSTTLLGLIQSIPSGVVFLSQDLPGLVETSNNIGIVRTETGGVEVICSLRSSVDPAMTDLADCIRATARLAGADAEVVGSYPGWEVNLDSQVLKTAKRVYANIFGAEPSVEAIHAGLEAGVIASRIEGEMDVISFGPNIRGAHAPGERVSIGSVGKSYRLLKALLDDISSSN